jgi:hypothetical protein
MSEPGVAGPTRCPTLAVAALSTVAKIVVFFGFALFLAGLAWFAHFNYSWKSVGFSVATMVIGILIAAAGGARWGDLLFRVRRYFRRGDSP